MVSRIEKITEIFMSNLYIDEPADINRGWCYYWAYIVYKFFGGILITVKEHGGGHAFVEIDGLYYDSETPNGVDCWSSLPFFRHFDLDIDVAEEQVPETFIDYWERVGREGWDDKKVDMLLDIAGNNI
ncbi:MAG: hypothetical protein ACYSWP_11160 [Planctomycetota bacterium]